MCQSHPNPLQQIDCYSVTSSARPSSVMNSPVRRPLLRGGLRRRLPRDEFPAPAVEENEPQAARLAADLRLDRRATGDECGIARESRLTIAAGRALVLRLSRAQGGEPRLVTVLAGDRIIGRAIRLIGSHTRCQRRTGRLYFIGECKRHDIDIHASTRLQL